MYRILFILTFTLLPTDFVRAIPPPDLIISSAQAVFATVGLIASSLFIWWAQLWSWLMSNKKNKYIFAGSITLVFFLSFTAVTQFSNIRDIYWKKSIDAEIQTLWAEYEPVYSADIEETARFESLDISHGILWNDFIKVANGGDYQVVDIRDGYGYDSGHIPGSIHMRFGDLINGEWEKLLPYKNQPIYIVCFLGSTGAVIINFLEGKGFTQLYQPPNGIRVAVRTEPDLPFEGNTNAFGDVRKNRMLTKYQFQIEIKKNNIEYVDMRAPSHYNNPTPVTMDKQFFREFMKTADINTFLDHLDKTKEYLAICDSSASCYQGELFSEDLERRGLGVIGVYRHY